MPFGTKDNFQDRKTKL